jgi:ribosomal protein L40E
VVLLAAVASGLIYGPSVAVLVLAAGLLVAAILGFWTSIRALFGETKLTGEDAFALGAPTAEHEQKRAVLRAIKDLEFERTVGKISEEDYAVLMARYRAEAKRLLRTLDDRAAPARARVEKLVERHLAAANLAAADGEEMSDRTCPSCAASNDPDAVFCKKCAVRLVDDDAEDHDAEDHDDAEDDAKEEGP